MSKTSNTNIKQILQNIGNIYYVSQIFGDDSYTGKTPNDSLASLGAAISKLIVGDKIILSIGAYTETGLDLDKDFCEIVMEYGASIAPPTGTGIVVSGSNSRITGTGVVAVANTEIGINCTGDFIFINGIAVVGAGIGVQFNGNFSGGIDLQIISYITTGIHVNAASGIQIIDCRIGGSATSTGFKVSGPSLQGIIKDSLSVGNGVAGYELGATVSEWTVLNCSSGGGDGGRIDVDQNNTWQNYTFDDIVYKTTTFSGATTEYNVYKLTGSVKLIGLNAEVTTVIPNTSSTIHYELYSINGTVDITADPGPNIQNGVVGALLVRNADAADPLDYGNPNSGPATVENTGGSVGQPSTETSIDIIADPLADTFVRILLSVPLASGSLHHHASYIPISDDGFLESV